MKVNMAIKANAKTVRHWLHPELTGVLLTKTGRRHRLPQKNPQ